MDTAGFDHLIQQKYGNLRRKLLKWSIWPYLSPLPPPSLHLPLLPPVQLVASVPAVNHVPVTAGYQGTGFGATIRRMDLAPIINSGQGVDTRGKLGALPRL